MMLKKIWEWDKQNFERFKRFQLAFKYKKIGVGVCLFLFLAILGVKFAAIEPYWIQHILKNGLLVSMLIISLSKEKIEDEYIVLLRAQSYRIAFVLGVLYSIIQPYVNYGVDLIIRADKATLEISYFQVLAFMLLVQLMLFHVLIKKCNT